MASIPVSWNAPASWSGIAGHRIYAGKQQNVYTEVSSNIAAQATSGVINVPTEGNWWVAVAACDANWYSGPYSTPVLLATTGNPVPPVGVPVASVR